jgi:TRAP-type mannitol/chloroaromatic compound transport system substrate-binding protein
VAERITRWLMSAVPPKRPYSGFDDAVLKVLHEISRDVVAEAGSGNDLSRKIYASYQQFRASIMDWSNISERAYLNSRGLA